MAGLVVAAVVIAGCSSVNAVNRPHNKGKAGKGGYGYNIAVVTHGGPGDAFWSIVKNGVDQAGKDLGDTISYQSSGDPTTQAQFITAAVNKKPDGLVVSMANPEALKSAVESATKAGIPTIVINSGVDQWQQYGALTYIGSSESIAGQSVGSELKKDGMKKAICVIHEAGNASLEQRCAGVAKTFGSVTNLQVDINNLDAAQSTIQSKLQQDKSIDAVVTLNAQVATKAEAAISAAGSSAKIATFDLDAQVCKDILSGKLLFSVDQQPYLQGYLAVQMLTLYQSNRNVLGGGQPVLTGPSLVTKDNAAEVLKLAAAGTR